MPPIGDTPLYSTRDSTRKTALSAEGQRVYNAFTQSITLSRVFHQEGDNPEKIRFRDALLQLRTYSTNIDDYELFKTRFWDNLSEQQKAKLALHLLPQTCHVTCASVDECNIKQLAALAKPVVKCKAKHNCPAAKKASDEDADGLQPEVLLAEGAKVMVTHNLWTAKGTVNCNNIFKLQH